MQRQCCVSGTFFSHQWLHGQCRVILVVIHQRQQSRVVSSSRRSRWNLGSTTTAAAAIQTGLVNDGIHRWNKGCLWIGGIQDSCTLQGMVRRQGGQGRVGGVVAVVLVQCFRHDAISRLSEEKKFTKGTLSRSKVEIDCVTLWIIGRTNQATITMVLEGRIVSSLVIYDEWL
jgi:hypothetical protein